MSRNESTMTDRTRRRWLTAVIAVVVVTGATVGIAAALGRTSTVAMPTESAAVSQSGAATNQTQAPSATSPSPFPSVTPTPVPAPAYPSAPQPVTGTTATAAPVPLSQPADFGTGVTATISGMTAVQGEASRPGDVAGPAVQVSIRLHNGSDRPLSLQGVVVDLTYGADATPALSLSGPGVSELSWHDVAAGGDQVGTYVFAVPLDQRSSVQVAVNYSVAAPTVVFTGAAPAS